LAVTKYRLKAAGITVLSRALTAATLRIFLKSVSENIIYLIIIGIYITL